jgi:hypothetical protein
MNGQEPSGCVSRCFLETQPPNNLGVIDSFDAMTPFFLSGTVTLQCDCSLFLMCFFLLGFATLVFRCLTTRRVPGRGCEKEARQQQALRQQQKRVTKNVPNKNPGNMNREFLTDPDSDDKDSRCLAPGLLSGPFAQDKTRQCCARVQFTGTV